jgi:predicted O-methyltransferase YrrM
MVFELNKFKYTKKWFLQSELKKYIHKYLNNKNELTILEIGCYEGLSSVFLAEQFLNNTNSRLICVEPFLNIENNDHIQHLSNNTESSFDYNINICNNSDKIKVFKITSDNFFENYNSLMINTKYDFIYIDGCHEQDFITRDMENSFKVLKNNGIMWMDDYGGGPKNALCCIPMNNFINKYKNEIEIIHKGYQLGIRKL